MCAARSVPGPTERLGFAEMTDADLDDLHALMGDPAVMHHYPAPLTREQTQAWIDRNRSRYAQDGHGLWTLRTHDGAFVGECGLTMQPVNGTQRLEVGYHVLAALQGRGYATEAAAACLDHAWLVLGAAEVVSISTPGNLASRRVVEKLGFARLDDDVAHPTGRRLVLGLESGAPRRGAG